MSAWALLTLLIGGLGLSAGTAFLFVGGGGGLAALGLLRFLPSPAEVWKFFTHPIGVLLTMFALSGGFWIAGDLHGKRAGRALCESRIEQSRADARAADERITAERRQAAAVQEREAAARETAIKSEVQSYVEEVAKRTGEACRAGVDADRFNDGLGLQDEPGVPRAVPLPPARPGRRPVTGAVPQGSSVR